jgi:hypothetical protein
MGYCIYQQDSAFSLPKRMHRAALVAIQSLTGNYTWVRTPNVLASKTLDEALLWWRWSPEMDREGNILAVEFTGQKIGDNCALWEALAPFVTPGSYIRMEGEDGRLWHWRFDGAHAHYVLEKKGREDELLERQGGGDE